MGSGMAHAQRITEKRREKRRRFIQLVVPIFKIHDNIIGIHDYSNICGDA